MKPFTLLTWLWHGILDGIPPCCIIAFLRGRTAGIVMRGRDDVYCACPYHASRAVSQMTYQKRVEP